MKSLRKYLAEGCGTFLLTGAVISSITSVSIPTPLIAALTLMVIVLVIGPVSGAHVNPAVTIGLWSIKKIKFNDAIWYIVAQLIGGFVASLVFFAFLVQTPIAQLPSAGTYSLVAELLGTFVFVFGVSTAVIRGYEGLHAAVTVGFSLLLGVMLAATGSLGVLNPAVALGLELFTATNSYVIEGNPVAVDVGANVLAYALMPLIGGALGAWKGRWFAAKA